MRATVSLQFVERLAAFAVVLLVKEDDGALRGEGRLELLPAIETLKIWCDAGRKAVSRRQGAANRATRKSRVRSGYRRTSRGEEDDENPGRSHAFLKLAYVVELLHVEPRLDAGDVQLQL